MTRTAFRATLEITDHDAALALTGVGAQVEIKDAAGNLANSRFQIEAPTLERVDRIDGSGTIAANTTATVRWLLIPSDEAAPTNATDFYVGGQFSYTQGGAQAQVPLEPVKITVYPDAALDLVYFHQRDVYSDDPFTPEVEPAQPYALAVMIKNRGGGAARNLTISSAQPQIVSNDKGLLIDFRLIGARLDGTNAANSLTLNFGQINPGGIKVAEWLFTSSLQGFFTDFSATFQHLDTLGNIHLSTIKSVTIHEMNHIVEAGYGFADGQADFLVNDVADPDHLPDTVWLSNGTTNAVQVVQECVVDGSPSATNLQVGLTAPVLSGWVYLRVPEPSGGSLELAAVTRSDGSVIKVGSNVWSTDRVFPGPGLRAISTNLLHLFDYNSPGSYILTYSNAAPADSIAPTSQVAALAAQSAQQFSVTWSGQDNAGGSGVAYFDIFVSENSGAFVPWLQQTTLSGAVFSGTNGSSYAFYSLATDGAGNREPAHGGPDASTAVTLINHAPVLAAIPDQSINEGTICSRALTASDPDAGDVLTYTLAAGAPAGMTLDPSTHQLSWATGEADGPGTNLIRVIVQDNGLPSVSATQTFRVVVNEVNLAPVLGAMADRTVYALSQMVAANGAMDSDIPANVLSYALLNAPTGAVVSSSGVVTWTPTLAQAPSTNLITTVATDNGAPPLSATNSFRVVVPVPNHAPVLAAIADRTVNVNQRLWVTNSATDSDVPAQTLTFSLGANAPAGAIITTNGMFEWSPSFGQGSTTNPVTVWVADDGSPPMSNSVTFTITVPDCLEVSLGNTVVEAGQNSSVPIGLRSSAALTNTTFTFAYPPDRLTNFVVTASSPLVLAQAVRALDAGHVQVSLTLSPSSVMQGATEVAQLGFTALYNQMSAFVALPITNLGGVKPDGGVAATTYAQPGRVVFLANQPLLEAWLTTNRQRRLTLYGKPNQTYGIEYRTNLAASGSWSFLTQVQVTGLSQDISNTGPNAPAIFYRAYEGVAPPGRPMLEAVLTTNRTRKLILHGTPGLTYGIQYRTNLVAGTPWTFLTEVQLSGPSQEITNVGPNAAAIFYRAYQGAMPPTLTTVVISNQVQLTLCGQPGKTYRIEYTTNQANGAPWMFVADVVLNSPCLELGRLMTNAPAIAYRVVENTNSLRLVAALAPGSARKLTLCGEPGKMYYIEYKTNLTTTVPWRFLAQVAQTNYCQDISSLGVSGPVIFYRAYEVIPSRLLQMRREGANYIIEWPAAYLLCGLEETAALGAGASWVPSGAMIQQAGDKLRATVAVGATGKFYRLRCRQ